MFKISENNIEAIITYCGGNPNRLNDYFKTEQERQNKYLDDLGIPIEEYGTNFISEDDPRQAQFAEECKLYGFDSRETWSLDTIFIEWLYSHLMMYKEYACVDLTVHKFEYNGKTYTQGEAIDYILDVLRSDLTTKLINKDIEKIKDAVKLWAEIMPVMWW